MLGSLLVLGLGFFFVCAFPFFGLQSIAWHGIGDEQRNQLAER